MKLTSAGGKVGALPGRGVSVGMSDGTGVKEDWGDIVTVGRMVRVRVGRDSGTSVADATNSTVGASAGWQAVNISIPKKISNENDWILGTIN
jgi:hypothetical protein